MKYTIESILADFKAGNRQKYVFFWGNQPTRSGQLTASCLSQWWPAPFQIGDVIYPTAEHWMMAQKALLFGDGLAYKKILEAKSPAEAKKIGREVVNYEESKWLQKRYAIVLKGAVEKFAQNRDLLSFLLSTGDRILVEASPVDPIWGIGLAANDERIQNPHNWQGLNLLGFALMEARDMLAARSSER